MLQNLNGKRIRTATHVLAYGVIGLSFLSGIGIFFGSTTVDTPLSVRNEITASALYTQQSNMSTTTKQETTRTKGENVSPVRVPILVYHGIRDTLPSESSEVRQFNVSPNTFRQQMQYLKDRAFTPITFGTLHGYLSQGIALPAKPIIISFDDGWESQREAALPILKEYGFVATFFLYPNVLGHEHYMTWDGARSLVDAGMEIGSHSKSHQYMTKQESEKLDIEIAGSKRILEEALHVAVTTFAYPFGLSNDDIRTRVKDAGYTTGRALEHGTTQSSAYQYQLASYLARSDFSDFVYFVETLD